MNPYTVTWEQEPFDALADLWLSASDRRAITTACDAIDAALKSAPYTSGQLLCEGLYKLIIEPLAVTYSIEEDDRLVVVQAVKLVR